MKRVTILLLLTMMQWVLAGSANAQYFSFDDAMPQRRAQRNDDQPREAPKYKGGNKGLNRFLEKNFHSPSDRKKVDGRIVVAVLIGTKGKVEQTQLLQSVDPALDAEAVRVAKMLKFKPAKQGKKKVRSRYDVVFPIRRGRLSFLNLPTIEL